MNGNDIRVTVRSGFPLLLAAAILSTPMRTEAEDAPAVDTSKWVCKYCPFEEGMQRERRARRGYVSDDSFKFGEYTGLNEEGGFLVGNATARYRNKDGTWLDLSATDLGLDSRSLSIEGGKQGGYKLWLGYKELPHFITDTAISPFTGTARADLACRLGPWRNHGHHARACLEPQWHRTRDEAPRRRSRSCIDFASCTGNSPSGSVTKKRRARSARLAHSCSFRRSSRCPSITTPTRWTFRRRTPGRDCRCGSRTTGRSSRTTRTR